MHIAHILLLSAKVTQPLSSPTWRTCPWWLAGWPADMFTAINLRVSRGQLHRICVICCLIGSLHCTEHSHIQNPLHASTLMIAVWFWRTYARGAGKSLARPTSRCLRTEWIVSLEANLSTAQIKQYMLAAGCQATLEGWKANYVFNLHVRVINSCEGLISTLVSNIQQYRQCAYEGNNETL